MTMNPKLQSLMRKLSALDTAYTRHWTPECDEALESAIAQGITERDLRGPATLTASAHSKIGFNGYEQQKNLLADLVAINAKLNANQSIKSEIYVISSGQMREAELFD
jgi:hypothetical protein